VTFGSHQRSDPFAPAPEVQAIDLQYKMQERPGTTMMLQAIVTVMWYVTMTPVDCQSEIAYIEHSGMGTGCVHLIPRAFVTQDGGLPVTTHGCQEPPERGETLPK